MLEGRPQLATSFYALYNAALNGHDRLVRLLLEHGARNRPHPGHGSTPLAGAAQLGHTAVVQCLLDCTADASGLDSRGQSALLKAAGGGRAEVVRLLLDRGAAPDASESARALDAAEKHGHAHVTAMLRDFEARRGGL